MTRDEVEAAVLDELGKVLNTDTESLIEALNAQGDQWPCDSLVLAEVVVVLEDRLSVELPMDDATAASLRTVNGLVNRILGLLDEVGANA